MAAASSAPARVGEYSPVIERIFDAPRRLLFYPKQLVQWLDPQGFTALFRERGGKTRLTLKQSSILPRVNRIGMALPAPWIT